MTAKKATRSKKASTKKATSKATNTSATDVKDENVKDEIAKDNSIEAATPSDTTVSQPEVNVTHIEVRASQSGFRRAGRAWPSEKTVVAIDEFTAEELQALMDEPALQVVAVGEHAADQ